MLLHALGAFAFISSVLGVWYLGKVKARCFPLFIAGFAVQIYIFVVTDQPFLVLQMLFLAGFNANAWWNWYKEGIKL